MERGAKTALNAAAIVACTLALGWVGWSLARHVASGILSANAAPSPAGAPQRRATELVGFLYIQNAPPPQGALKGTVPIEVVWLPKPVEALCTGKTAGQCATIDYCIRTTNRNVPMCQSLGVDLAKLPAYPAGIYPRRMLSVSYARRENGLAYLSSQPTKGLSELIDYFEKSPRAMFDRLSGQARFKARLRVTRSPDDDAFELLEVLALPPR
jgi:hypothetical protein